MSLAAAAAEAAHIKKEIWTEVLSCQQKQHLLLSLFPCIVLMATDQIPFRLKGSFQARNCHYVLLTKPM